MRRYLLSGLGVGLAVGGAAQAQAPAARLGPVQRLTAEEMQGIVPAGAVARGQMPNPTPPAQPAAPQPTLLGQPKLFGNGPSVTEQRAMPAAGGQQVYPTGGYPVPTGPGFAPPIHPGAVYTPPATADAGLFPVPAAEAPLFGGECGPVAAGMTSTLNKWCISAEYLSWWTRSAALPALVTTSAPQFDGIIGTGNTQILYGATTTANTRHDGGRFGLGYWFGTEQRWGIDSSLFFLTTTRTEFTANTGQYPLLARPFVNAQFLNQTSEVVATPMRASTGSIAVGTESSLWGADVNLRRFVTKTNCARLDFLAGFRYLSLEEELSVRENFQDNSGTAGLPISGTVFDRFRTTNRFYGAQVGFTGEARRGRWFSNLTAKVGFGTVFQSVNINGSQSRLFADGTTQSVQGGLLAVPGANIGDFKRNEFAVLPEVGLNVGYYVTPRLRLYVGYNFLYLSNVLRPGDQIDTSLDVTRIPNFTNQATMDPTILNATRLAQPRPAPTFRETDFFAQGVNVGLQFNW